MLPLKIMGFFVHNNLETEAQRSYAHDLQDRERACSNSFGLLPQGYCEHNTPKY